MITDRNDRINNKKQRISIRRAIYSHTLIILGLLLLQFGLIFFTFRLLAQNAAYLIYAFTGLGLVLSVHIMNTDMDPGFRIAWLIPLIAVPAFGAVLYLFMTRQKSTVRTHQRLKVLTDETAAYMQQDETVFRRLRETAPDSAGLAFYMYHSCGFPVFDGAEVTYFPGGESFFEALLAELEGAERFIFLEFFIVEQGEMLDRLLAVLKRKVAEGVEVRFMYDGFCTLSQLPYDFDRELTAAGIRCRVFSPIRPILSTLQNNRDHRKIAVIDGRTAFTGGANIADEYINVRERFGHWKDASCRLRGAAAVSFTMLFLQMWNVCGEGVEHYEDYVNPTAEAGGEGFVIPYGDIPLDDERLGLNVYLDILYHASDYVHIMTPYLILNRDMETALTLAAKRGVDVKLILPHIPDKRYANDLAKAYYPSLLRSGVEIWEYEPGFVHAKVFVSDDSVCTVGTVNLDYRSLFLHFECGLYICGNPAVAEAERDCRETLARCRRITLEDYRRLPLVRRLLGRMLCLFAPFM